MHERASNKRPRDVNQLAVQTVELVTERDEGGTAFDASADQPKQPAKNPAAVALGRLGGLKGGKARALKLSADERRAIARKAAETRWHIGKGRTDHE